MRRRGPALEHLSDVEAPLQRQLGGLLKGVGGMPDQWQGSLLSMPDGLTLYGETTYNSNSQATIAMPTQESTRTARVEARIAPDSLAVVRRAAELQGRSISDFLVAAALKDAHQTIEDAQIIRLSVDDQHRFADRLLNPPPLAPAMQRALSARKRLIPGAK